MQVLLYFFVTEKLRMTQLFVYNISLKMPNLDPVRVTESNTYSTVAVRVYHI